MEQQQTEFKDWAVVEMFGHQKIAGFVQTQAFGAAVMFRVEVPELPERERTLTAPQYHDGQYLLPGSVIKSDLVPGYTKLLGVGSIYAITPCAREEVMVQLDLMTRAPMTVMKAVTRREIAAGEEHDEDDPF